MKKPTALLLLIWISLFPASSFAGIDHLLPRPQTLNVQGKGTFPLTQVQLDAALIESEIRAWITEEYNASITPTAERSIRINKVSKIDKATFQDEAYQIDITPSTITLNAVTSAGAYRGLQTLKQLSNQAKNGKTTLPTCSITDWAAFPYRGYMHDVGRSYIEFDELKRQVALLARYKVNLFHWHLTENQGWRLESKQFPQLNDPKHYTRHPGKFYTREQAREMVSWCKKHHMKLIVEIDMPGHSEAFTRAMGFDMQSPEGIESVKTLIDEAAEVFSKADFFHIGTDEVHIKIPEFVPTMVAHIRSKGLKVGSWNPGFKYAPGEIDLVHMWSSRGRPLENTTTLDSRYHYLNHFDTFADLVALYRSNICNQAQADGAVHGVIIAVWNDRMVTSDEQIMRQNFVYPCILAMAERTWIGGGKGYFDQIGCLIPTKGTDEFAQFADFERRLLHEKENHLRNEPIFYVRQTDKQWRITDPFPNEGDLTRTFPPEKTFASNYTHNGTTYATHPLIGAGTYLRHVWGEKILPGFYQTPKTNSTAYAYTYVYSPKRQTVGAYIETHNYSRSEKDLAPPQGKWDYKESRILVNDREIAPPVWENTHTARSNETPLRNENAASRLPEPVLLQKGWNKVLLKLPISEFKSPHTRLVKWMFSFAFVSLDGKKEIPGLIYSPEQKK